METKNEKAKNKQVGTQLTLEEYKQLKDLLDRKNEEAQGTPGNVTLSSLIRYMIVSYINKQDK